MKTLSRADTLQHVGEQLQAHYVDDPIPIGIIQQEVSNIYGDRIQISDFCYNSINQDPVSMTDPMFIKVGTGMYRYLGRSYPYSGQILWKPKGGPKRIVGEWINGKCNLINDPRQKNYATESKMIQNTRQAATASVSIKPIVQFQIGKTYDRKTHINGPFGGSAQSGIAPSSVADVIFLFTGESGGQYGYKDKVNFDEDGGIVFSYTGEGQDGDMEFTRGNRAILDHGKDGRALHLFRSLGKSKGQKYLGEFVYASHHLAQGSDKNGEKRQLIIFHLVPVEQAAFLEDSDDTGMEVDSLPPKTLSMARSLAIAATSAAVGKSGESAIRTLYKRSKAVKDYVLMRANGLCEACKNPAPFIRANGTPYLEPHHTTRMSDGGSDHPRYVGAVCPACHREIHHGKNGAAKNDALQSFLLKLEAEA